MSKPKYNQATPTKAKQSNAFDGIKPSDLKKLAGFLDVLIQIDLAQKAKAKTIENTTK